MHKKELPKAAVDAHPLQTEGRETPGYSPSHQYSSGSPESPKVPIYG